MKTRAALYGQEATELLREISMYPGLLEEQIYRLHAGKEEVIKNLLSHLKKQGRIIEKAQREYFLYGSKETEEDIGMRKAVWVLVDFIEQVEYHSVSEFPAKLIFFRDGELYEVIYVPMGQEALIRRALCGEQEGHGKRIVVVDMLEQAEQFEVPNITGFCMVDGTGKVQYYKKQS